jgi:hypothetical protein
MRVGFLKICWESMSVQRQLVGFAKTSANGLRNSTQPTPNSRGRKKPTREITIVA